MEGSTMSPADVAAVVGNTDRNINYGYPIMPIYGSNGFGNGMTGDGSWLWFILILALMGGWGNNGNGFGGGFGGGFNNEYAWLSNGQKEIMNNTNNGFDTLHLSNQIEGTRDAIHNISTQLCDGFHGVSNQICNSTANVTSAITDGFYGAEIAANNRQMADMQQNFNNQIATLQGFNGVTQGFNQLGSQLSNCCCDIREGIAGVNYNNAIQTNQLQAQIASENCADRAALSDGIRDIITNQTANTQKIIDEIFRDRLDEKDSKIADLQRQLQMSDLRASQIAQTANIVDSTYARLRDCPIESTPIYGRTPIFTCPNNNGCGCNGNGSYL